PDRWKLSARRLRRHRAVDALTVEEGVQVHQGIIAIKEQVRQGVVEPVTNGLGGATGLAVEQEAVLRSPDVQRGTIVIVGGATTAELFALAADGGTTCGLQPLQEDRESVRHLHVHLLL